MGAVGTLGSPDVTIATVSYLNNFDSPNLNRLVPEDLSRMNP